MSLCLAFPLKQLFGVVSRICSPSAVLRGPGALAGLCCPSASLHPSQDPSPAGLRGPAPGQETGCKTNHSCNMRESTWSVWSRKPRAAGRLAPGRCQRGQGWRPWVAAAGPRSLRVQEPGLGGKAEPCAGTPCAPRREQGGGRCAGGMGWVFQLLGCFFFLCRMRVVLPPARRGNAAGASPAVGPLREAPRRQDLPQPTCRLLLLGACGQPDGPAQRPRVLRPSWHLPPAPLVRQGVAALSAHVPRSSSLLPPGRSGSAPVGSFSRSPRAFPARLGVWKWFCFGRVNPGSPQDLPPAQHESLLSFQPPPSLSPGERWMEPCLLQRKRGAHLPQPPP